MAALLIPRRSKSTPSGGLFLGCATALPRCQRLRGRRYRGRSVQPHSSASGGPVHFILDGELSSIRPPRSAILPACRVPADVHADRASRRHNVYVAFALSVVPRLLCRQCVRRLPGGRQSAGGALGPLVLPLAQVYAEKGGADRVPPSTRFVDMAKIAHQVPADEDVYVAAGVRFHRSSRPPSREDGLPKPPSLLPEVSLMPIGEHLGIGARLRAERWCCRCGVSIRS